MSNTEEINRITARHVAKALTALEEVGTPSCARDVVRRHFWFLKDDLMEASETRKELENGQETRNHLHQSPQQFS